jgi:hypothetical protein
MDRRRPWFTIGMTALLLGSIGISTVYAKEAKSPQANWDNLKGLAPGDAIRIVLNDKKSYKAKFQSVSDEAIVVRLVTGEQTFTRESVLRVSTKGKSHRLRNALIGAAAGGGIVAAGAGSNCNYDKESCSIALAVGVPFAIAGGAGVGAVIPTGRWHDVYRAR